MFNLFKKLREIIKEQRKKLRENAVKIENLGTDIWINMGYNIQNISYEKLNDTVTFIENFGFIPQKSMQRLVDFSKYEKKIDESNLER